MAVFFVQCRSLRNIQYYSVVL